MEKTFRKVEYMIKEKIHLTDDNATPEAKAVIEGAPPNSPLVLRVTINTPVFIEAAAPLTPEGIKEVSNLGNRI